MKPSRPDAVRMNRKDTLDRSPLGHKTLFTFAKTAGQKLAANQCRMIGTENRLTPDPSSIPLASTADRALAWSLALKLVEADGIEPTTSSLQS